MRPFYFKGSHILFSNMILFVIIVHTLNCDILQQLGYICDVKTAVLQKEKFQLLFIGLGYSFGLSPGQYLELHIKSYFKLLSRFNSLSRNHVWKKLFFSFPACMYMYLRNHDHSLGGENCMQYVDVLNIILQIAYNFAGNIRKIFLLCTTNLKYRVYEE